MEAYLQAFVCFEQNDWARLLLMAKFTYNNAKNASIGHMLLKLNCGFYPQVSYKEVVNPRSQSKLTDELVTKLTELMAIHRDNL